MAQGILFIILLSMAHGNNSEPEEYTLFSGITFKQRHDIVAYKSTIPWSYEIDLNLEQSDLNKYTSKIHCASDDKSNMCLVEKNLVTLKSTIMDQINILHKDFLEQKPEKLVRNARSLKFIGSFAYWCCEIINSEIHSKTVENQKDIISHLNEVLHLAKQNANNTFLLKKHFDKLTDNLKNTTRKFQENFNILQKEIDDLRKIPDMTNLIFIEIRQIWEQIARSYMFNNLKHIQQLCNVRTLSKAIIPQDLLKQDLKLIQNHLWKDGHQLALDMEAELDFYYKLPLTRCHWSQTRLSIKLQLPIVEKNQNYLIFENRPILMQWEERLCSFTKEKFLVIKSETQLHIVSENNKHCNPEVNILCKIPRLNYRYNLEYKCVASLFKSTDIRSIQKYCSINCRKSDGFVHITQLDFDVYMITNLKDNLFVKCQNQTLDRTIKPIQVGAINLQLACTCILVDKDNNILIQNSYPCDPHRLEFEPKVSNLVPNTWSKLDSLSLKFGPHDLTTSTKNISEILNQNWPLQMETFDLQTSIRITEDNYNLKNKHPDIYNNETLISYILIGWTSILTLITLGLIFIVAILHFKIAILVKTDSSNRPPPLPERNHPSRDDVTAENSNSESSVAVNRQ